MIGFNKRASIRQKIIAISTLTSGIVLTVAATAMLLSDLYIERNAIVKATSMLADLIEINVGAALVFKDPEAATEVLSELKAVPDIAAAFLYSSEGDLFAEYTSENPQHQNLQAQTTDNTYRNPLEKLRDIGAQNYITAFKSKLLDLSAPIKVDGETVGLINIYMDLEPMIAGFYRLGAYTLVCLLLAFSLAYLLSSRLQRSVTGPIETYSRAMLEVSQSADYTRRVEYLADDEVGMLGASFNMMLQQVQNRDQQLENLVEELRAATHAKSQFLANMSHEIRTPMNSIMGITSLLLDMPLNERQQTYFETIDRSAQSLMVIINDILDISKIEAGHLSIEDTEFNLEDVILHITNTFLHPAKSKGLRLEVRIAPGTPMNLLSDAGRLQQVLINLVGNAIKFTPSGSVLLNVSVQDGSDSNDELLFEVTDTGIGVAGHAKTRIFSEFSQADESTTRRFGGTGLGLSFSKHVVEMMGGQIGVESTEGKGSRFWFTLPLIQTIHSSGSNSLTSRPTTEIETGKDKQVATPDVNGRRSGYNARVLIVDDSKPNLFILTETMKTLGLDVTAAEGGKKAVELAQTQQFDLVIMDIQMPDMDGLEATRKIRDFERENFTDRHLPIIAFSANAMEGDRELYLQAEMDDYLSKPFQKEAFLAVLDKWLEKGNGH